MFTAEDILEAVRKIDGGCLHCIDNFLDQVPKELEKELRGLLNKNKDYIESLEVDKKLRVYEML